MKIAFCITCKGRTQHIKQTLPKNLAENPEATFVLLDYSSNDGLMPYLQEHHRTDIKSGHLVVYSFPTAERFHVAHAKNMAARCGILEGADILITLDADNFTGPRMDCLVRDAFTEPGIVPGIFMCPNYAHIKSLPHGALRPARGYAGRLAIWAQSFVKVGGYDESFDTWRGEDIDMNFRLQRMDYQMRYIPNEYLHAINHSAEVRFKEYPHAQKYETEEEMRNIRARTQTVVNNGKFGCGTVYRNFKSHPVQIKSVPTRVFGIGMHKTGTTSLHEAFKLLGLDSFHWGRGEAPLIWQEMNALGRSPTLEHWYALCDLPIPLLYRELDAAYPGSKFILTVRNEAGWLKSVEGLWDYARNSTRHLWDVYPFSNHIHTVLYGQAHFDAEVMLERYRCHNAEVLEYFRDRDDLLVMDMDASALKGWSDLCYFLDLPVPEVPFPRHNRTSVQEIGT